MIDLVGERAERGRQILGGDGFHCQVDPVNNQYVYAEWQYGNLNRSTNGGTSFSSIGSGLSGRKNWSMPVILAPSNPATIFAGTQWVYRSANRGTSSGWMSAFQRSIEPSISSRW